jgi:hypothetical protein
MAGDWIKWLVGLAAKPEVLRMADLLQLTRYDVAARLMVIWEWGDSETTDGYAPSVTKTFLDERSGVPGFANAMEKVGWLEVENGGIRFPRWDEHNSQTAKARALTFRRMRKKRLRNRNARRVTKPSLETETETESKTAPPTPHRSKSDTRAENVMVYWNEHRGKPRVAQLTAARRQKLRARFEEPAFAHRWKEAIDCIAKAPAACFLNGGNDRNWRLDFDFFIKNDTNYVRILEGFGQDVPGSGAPADRPFDPTARYDVRGNRIR